MLSEEGYRQLRRHGHAHTAAACAPAAAGDVRFLDAGLAAAVDDEDADRCRALFAAPWADLPVLLDREVTATVAHVELRIPPDLRALRGHFPMLPVVPGAVHLAWVMHFARADLGVGGALAGMDQVKFRRIVQPGHRLILSITLQPRRDGLAFRLGTRDELFSSGRLFLDGGGA